MKSRFLKIILILLLFPSYFFSQELWKQTNGPSGGTIENILSLPDGNIFATLAHQGVIRSVDKAKSWTKVNQGLTTTSVLAIHVHSNGYLFAGTVADGIFRSVNNGDVWINVKQINDLPFTDNIRSFTSDDQGYIYAGAQFSGVFRSTNDGTSWNKVNNGLTTRNIEAMVSTANGYVFAGTMTGVFRTTNHGNSWHKLEVDNCQPDISTMHVTGDGVLYIGSYDQGISRSFDNGNTWEKINYGLSTVTGEQYPVIYTITSDPKNQVYAGSYLNGVFYLDKSEDRWYKTNSNLLDKNVLCLTTQSDNTLLAGTSRGGVFSTNTNIINWKEKNQGIYATDIYDLSASIDGYIFAAVFGRGIYSSKDNGGTWNPVNAGLTTPYVFSIVTNTHGALFAGTYDGQFGGISYGHGVFRSTDSGSSWVPTNNGISSNWTNKLAVNPVNNDLYTATLNSNAVYKSSNNGSNWVKVIDDQTANAFTFNSNGDVFAAIYNSGIYRSSNDGVNWVSINNGLPTGPSLKLPNENTAEMNIRRHSQLITNSNIFQKQSHEFDNLSLNVTSLCVDGHGTIYAGAYGEIYRSTDNGEDWVLIPAVLPYGWVTSIIFSNSNIMYAAIDGSVYKSTDYGYTWRIYNDGITNYTETLVCTPSNQIYAGSRGGSVFESVSSSLSITSFSALLEGSTVNLIWEVETDLLNQPITIERSVDEMSWEKIAVVSTDNSYKFTEMDKSSSKYFYRLVKVDTETKSILSKSVSVNNATAILNYKLDQNYPNPFNPSTTISFTVPQIDQIGSPHVILKVYDALGSEIKTLVNEVKEPGTHSVSFEASAYSSGVYFYTIQAGNFKETKKMILSK